MFSVLVSVLPGPIHCYSSCENFKSALSIFKKLVKEDCYNLVVIQYKCEVQK